MWSLICPAHRAPLTKGNQTQARDHTSNSQNDFSSSLLGDDRFRATHEQKHNAWYGRRCCIRPHPRVHLGVATAPSISMTPTAGRAGATSRYRTLLRSIGIFRYERKREVNWPSSLRAAPKYKITNAYMDRLADATEMSRPQPVFDYRNATPSELQSPAPKRDCARATVTFNAIYAVWDLHERRAAGLGGGHSGLDAGSSYSSIPEIAHRSAKRAAAAEPMTTESNAIALAALLFKK